MAIVGRVMNVGRFGMFSFRSSKVAETAARNRPGAGERDLLMPSGMLLALAGVGLCTFSCHQMTSGLPPNKSFPFAK